MISLILPNKPGQIITEDHLPASGGLVLIDKPLGISSFDCIRQLRRVTGIKKWGHAGTLDPLASGLMILGYNSGTKALSGLIKQDKCYRALFVLGVATDSLDREGSIIAEADVRLEHTALLKTAESLAGEHLLSVPAFAAVKIDGKRAYELARKGREFTLPTKPMRVISASDCTIGDTTPAELFLGVEGEVAGGLGRPLPTISVDVCVSSGTYIRSLAALLGERLGVPAMLGDLRRISIDQYTLEQSFTLPPFF